MPTGNPPWNFGSIKRLPKTTGPWMLNVQTPGRYRLTLRQLPREADVEIRAVRARIEIAQQELTSEIEPGSKGVVFEIDLPLGPTELVTYLYDDKDRAGGAYFTTVERLEAATP